MGDSKRALRRELRAREPVSEAESGAVVRALSRWLAVQPATGVLVYLGMPGEVAAEAVVPSLDGASHRFLTTRTPAEGPLTVHAFDAPREVHRYGFPQPAASAAAAELDDVGIVLVPALAFDRSGRRLGRGRGYYDELLARLPGRTFVGVTLERLLVDDVPVEPHDVAMTHLATEQGVTPVGPERKQPPAR